MHNFFSKKSVWLPILILILAGGFVYAFNLNNGLFWDDDDWIINNNFVHTISWDNIKFWLTHNTLAGVGLKSNYYRPFLFFTFAFNYMVAGIQPFFWHLTNNLIHVANAVMIFFLLRRFSGRLVAFLTALIFTVHPLQTEAITYISGRGDSLAVFFMLLSLVFYIAFLSDQGSTFLKIQGRTFLSSLKKAFKEALPYFGLVLIYGILRLTILNFQNTLNFYATPNLYSENLLYRLFTFMHVLADYFRLLLVPLGLHMERSMTVHTSLLQWPVWLGVLIILFILSVLLWLYKKNHPDFKAWLFGWGWFFAALAPVSGITPINAVIYEHWLYLPMVGFWFVVAYYLSKLFYNKNRPEAQGNSFLSAVHEKNFVYRSLSRFLIVALAVYLSFFGYQAIKRNILWGKPVEFYQDILKYEPESVRINNNLGNLHFNQGNIEKAEAYYRQAIEAEDVFPQPHFNIGSILQSRGDIFGAIKEFEKAISIDPNFYYPYQNLAVIYAQQGNLVKARENIEILKSLLPTNPRVFYNSALVYISLNDKKQALADLQVGLEYASLDLETGRLIEELVF